MMKHTMGGVALLAVLLAAGCDTAPGPAAVNLRPPVLVDLAYTPERVDLVSGEPYEIVDDSVRVPLSFEVTVEAGDEDVREVQYVVQSPEANAPPLATGTLTPSGNGRYQGSRTVRLPVALVANYTILVYALDEAGRASNQVRGVLTFNGIGEPPVIERVEAPSVVVRPAAGEEAKAVQIVAVVSDPDGLANISRVVFWNVNAPSNVLNLLDDGAETSGDETAGDGRFTRTVRIESTNQPGTNTFQFQATDLAGLTSNIVERQITVQ